MSIAIEPATRRPRVLVIDDEKGLRDMLSYFLTRNGYAVVLAASGEEALEKLGAEDFDVALCDVMMPGIDGLEVLRRSKGLSRRTEIIMVTGQPTLEAEAEAARLGAFDYVAKPYSLDRIFHLLSRALLRSRAKKVKEDEHAGGE